MNEQQALSRMISPGQPRHGKWRNGVLQIWITRACDKSCYGCTQGSNLGGKPGMISLDHFEQACISLKGYWGVVGVFGGNPATHPQFPEICSTLSRYFPQEQCGLWCNNPLGKGTIMRRTFNPAVSNLNVHLDRAAYSEFKRDWPESMPFGLDSDSRHSPPYVAMKDVIADESKRWELISNCDINKHWSAMLCMVRGQLRAYFCEIAGAQAMLHENDDPTEWPDAGLDPTRMYDFRYVPITYEEQLMEDPEEAIIDCDNPYVQWWQLGMLSFTKQVRLYCHRCGVPLCGYGELAQSTNGQEQVSATHADIYKPKRLGRAVQKVTTLEQLGMGRLVKMTDYLGNAKR